MAKIRVAQTETIIGDRNVSYFKEEEWGLTKMGNFPLIFCVFYWPLPYKLVFNTYGNIQAPHQTCHHSHQLHHTPGMTEHISEFLRMRRSEVHIVTAGILTGHLTWGGWHMSLGPSHVSSSCSTSADIRILMTFSSVALEHRQTT